MIVPSDARKKNLMNCAVGLQYLRQAGVMLCDEDGTEITEDDVVNGDKELILSLLWNIFVQLQVILLFIYLFQTLRTGVGKLSGSACYCHFSSHKICNAINLQVPLLIKKYNFVEEICKICGTSMVCLRLESVHCILFFNHVMHICKWISNLVGSSLRIWKS